MEGAGEKEKTPQSRFIHNLQEVLKANSKSLILLKTEVIEWPNLKSIKTSSTALKIQ